MEKERHVLVIFPHPDDEAFGVSGTIALNIENGTPVTYACLTLGEMGRNLGNPPFATRESLPKIRRQELVDAANALGIQDLRMLGLRDKTVEFEDDEELTGKISAFIDELNPSLIITFYPGYSVHPDHEATGRAVVRAVERIAPEERPKLHCVAFSNNSLAELGEPEIINDVTAVEDKKIAAIKAHRSQTESMVATWAEKMQSQDPAMLTWIRKERFWPYKWKR
ncbi:bacillithiol biosynthesis deacetylase BshB2 [Peribacillus cavernae]|uniref:Bacillithiol biosynthesis deacetylase BshB2 n=1 Tax=Peribacillus cavernae TaxID=1674310 RepID=A0A433HTC4_9BACI|nr:bacillithiol biosynthesis deacetylase BshB2 [Peribacillus cavernae]MDQ0218579.1 bacillithiol biosynthesis deacetylase BshB2 [Peribacillus cavernae]RUQ31568.1 bacillithiol biosynthesis deacetylase BshB2 [Peribacillus cavernae]